MGKGPFLYQNQLSIPSEEAQNFLSVCVLNKYNNFNQNGSQRKIGILAALFTCYVT